MIQIRELNSWSEFEDTIKKRLLFEIETPINSGPKIYRGHSDANWQLQTTLERATGEYLSVDKYYKIIKSIQSKIETFTGREWKLPTIDEFQNNLKNGGFYNIDYPTYNYMTYLRHYGFPSPLLDWTQSPFVAAYFAFKNTISNARSVAIYEFLATHDLSTYQVGNEIQVRPMMTFPRKNKRHAFQQGVYTVCLKEKNSRLHFISHEDPSLKDTEPYITKYILPASERLMALHNLQAYNINSYSLFGTEESLLESIFLEKYKWAELHKAIGLDDINDIWH